MTGADNRGDEASVGSRLYARVATNLRTQILGGELPPGTRLPGESALAHQAAVSRPTIRGALSQLQREGLIVTRQGIGSFVLPQRVRQTMAHLETLDTTLAEQGLDSSTRITEYLFTMPSARVRTALRLPADEDVLLVTRVHVIGEAPIARVRMCLPRRIGVHFSRSDMEQHAVYDLLPSRLGIKIGPASQTVRAESAAQQTALALQVADGAPVLVCERVTYSADLEPVIYAAFHYRADRFEFRASLSAHEWRVPWNLPGLVPLVPDIEGADQSEALTMGGAYAGQSSI
jgi:GntR family transcriptional regulator